MSFSKKNYPSKKTAENFVSKKKYPKANLENYSKLFVQLGLVLSLGIVYLLIQNKTFVNDVTVIYESSIIDNINQTESNVDYKFEQPKIVKPNIVSLAKIKKTDNEDDVPEIFIKNQDAEAPVLITSIPNVKIEENIDPKDDVFDVNFLEEAPLFPGCKGNNEQRKACFSEQINKYINKKFNSGLASELGLDPGIHRIFTMFKIDKQGNVIEIQAKAPHKRLKDEAIRVLNLLPKMTPGKQHGNAVKVRYSMPITFRVE